MDCNTPGFPVLHYLLEFAQIHVHWVSDAIQPSHPLSPPSPPAQSFSASGSFPVSWLFTSGGQSIGASASASVLPMNNQGWVPLGLTGLISLLSTGLSRVFSSTTVQKYCTTFYMVQPSHLYMTTSKTIALARNKWMRGWMNEWNKTLISFSSLALLRSLIIIFSSRVPLL